MPLRTLQNDFYRSLFSAKDQGRLGVYQYAHRARLEEAIREDFPLSLELCPEAQQTLEEFLSSPRSKVYTLNAFGACWVEFLRAHPSASELLRDLARWEWAEIESSFSEENPEFPPPLITLSDDPPVRAALASSAKLESFSFCVHEAREGAASPVARECRLLLWHCRGEFRWKELDAEEFGWFLRWKTAESWSELERALPAWPPERVQARLEELASLGAIRTI